MEVWSLEQSLRQGEPGWQGWGGVGGERVGGDEANIDICFKEAILFFWCLLVRDRTGTRGVKGKGVGSWLDQILGRWWCLEREVRGESKGVKRAGSSGFFVCFVLLTELRVFRNMAPW